MADFTITSDTGITAIIETAAPAEYTIATTPSISYVVDNARQGPIGVGLPSGGTTGQLLKKESNTDYDFEWDTLDKTDVGLTNVDNTSDANKPISTATQTALDAKQNLDADLTALAGISPSNDDLIQRKAGAWTNRTPAQVKTDLALVKGDVGLGNVDNTSDANKPVSTAQQTAIDAKVADAINNGTTTIAPSQNAVFDELAGKQPLDSDLTTIAGLTATTDNFMVATASAWASRTPTQARTQMGLGSLATESTVTEALITLADNTTNDASTTKHGFLRKLDNNTANFLRGDGAWATPAGAGDVTSNTATSVDNEVALFNSTTGKQIKRASATGIAKLTSGVLSAVTAPTGAIVGDTDTQTLTNKTINGSQLVNTSVSASKLNTGGAYATVATAQTTTSTTYTDLATAGPAVTVTIGANGLALVSIKCAAQNNTANSYTAMAFAISGGTTRAAGAPYEAFYQHYANNSENALTYCVLVTGLAAGSTTFTAKYRIVTASTGTFSSREISVIPL